MNRLLEPLDEIELERLDSFLLERIDPDASEGDTGVISISGLDGLFTALVSGPVMPQPSAWLPAVWGEHEPEWEDQVHFEVMTELMMRHLNTIAATLQEAPNDFEPLYLEDSEDGEPGIVVDDWCDGYARAMQLTQKRWREGGAEVDKLLQPILAFSSVTDWRGHELESDAEVEKLVTAITPNVRALHAFWTKRGRQQPEAASPWDSKTRRK